ncbi:glutathione S-transferase family protein [Roseofilum sp. BLCC_M154]|uniref:Glutathione S-transferase family protein n=1 Tax=Roseofilum acuticapitatum BLCC-M154 TaxID=3022444 RepID=A0ABT7AUI2_9CYAN|nr:glutathione S-transferase family protein [Roseofilum acuticapitatum]MDJ1170545.1 glutathione S-transferase family protein [Roseofilum acuticapitatum BLCC-M154]
MLELYQFEFSQFSEKVRLILDYKELEYRTIEVTPGVGQLELLKISGQRQVPVLKDGDTVIADSTAIALYLDRQYPEKPIMPTEPRQRGLCLMMEEWADESIGVKSRKALYGGLSQDPSFRTSVLPSPVPDFVKTFVGTVPKELFQVLGYGVGLSPEEINAAQESLKQDLEALSLILVDHPYLVCDRPTLADLAVAGLSILIKFPEGNYLNIPESLQGKGIPGLADNPSYQPFFEWRDRLYSSIRKSVSPPASNTSPTSIEIE